MNPQQKICIIGGGCAGLAAAVFFDAYGYKVHLIEKKSILGGRTYSFKDKKTDMWVDNGQHLLMGAYHNTLDFIGMIGAKRFVKPQSKLEVPLFDGSNQLLSLKALPLPGALGLISALFRLPNLSWSEKWSFIGLGQELKRIKKGNPKLKLDTNCEDWLIALKQSEKVRKFFWEPLILATLNDDPHKASAKLLAEVMIRGFMGSSFDSRMILPTTHLNEMICDPARDYLLMRGHAIDASKTVKKIHILDNHVQNLELEDGEKIKADYYLSAIPPAPLLKIIPEGYVESLPYFSNLSQFNGAPIVSINLWFDREIIPQIFVGTSDKKVHWYFNRNRLHDESHPPHHIMGVISGAYGWLESGKEEILKKTLEELYELYPQARQATLIHSLINKEREATLSLPPEIDILRPTPQSPFPNLLVIGDWVQTGLPCTIESAVTSAKMALNLVKESSPSYPT